MRNSLLESVTEKYVLPRHASVHFPVVLGAILTMSSKNAINQCIDKYNALTVADQTVLQALSMLYEPAAATVVASCLAGAGCRESPMRAFTPQNVATRLARLAKANFASERSVDVRGQKLKMWRCKPEPGEIAIRHAMRDGLFLPMAKAAISETRGRDWRGEGAEDNPRRRFRLAFHAGDWRLAGNEIGNLSEKTPGDGGAFLVELLRLQPDDSWRRTAKAEAFVPVLVQAIRDAMTGLIDPGALEGLAREYIKKTPQPLRDELVLTYVDMQTRRGKLRDANKVSLMTTELHLAAARLMPVLAEGEGDAVGLAATAMARRRGRIGTREALAPDSGAVWQTLAILIGDDQLAADAMIKRLAPGAVQEHPEAGALTCLRHAFLFIVGQASAARALPDAPPDQHPLDILCHALAMLRIDPRRLAGRAKELKAAAVRANAGGYKWLSAQLDAVSDAASGNRDTADSARWPLLTRFFKEDDAWRRGLRALDELAEDEGQEENGPHKRLAWLVNFPKEPENKFVPFEIQPIEQTLGRDGQWSKGRNVALKRIYQHADDLAYAGDQDRMIFSSLRFEFDGASQGFRFEPGSGLLRLIGHPYVFRGDAGGAKIDVAAGQFELSVSEKEGGCEIWMEPNLKEFLPGGEESAAPLDIDDLPDTVARLETPTRLRVYPLGGRERGLARVLGDGLAVPSRGREEALATLAALSGKIRLQSDIPELAGEGEIVESDVRPRFHIIPRSPGIKVEAWSHPLGDDGPAYRPGKGGRIITADVDGNTVRTTRDLDAERERASWAVRSCSSLQDHTDGDLSWLLEDPEDALSFLAETEELGDKIVLAWPKGGRFRVRRFRGLGGLSIRVNSTSEWFTIDGSLRVDEDLVIDIQKLLAGIRETNGRFIAIGEGEYLALTNELRRQLSDLEAIGEFRDGEFRLPSLASSILEGLEEDGAELEADEEWRAGLEKRRELASFTPELPKDFKADLRNYQLEGFQWMARLAEWGAGACLADDMGLGKTVQALAILVRRRETGPSLVVAPTSVCHNWIAETGRFAPTLNISQLGDGDRAAAIAALGPNDVLICSYSLLRQENHLLSEVKWGTVVLDEAQAIKNVSAKRSKAAMELDAKFRLITTGTPIENHLSELWNLFRFINPRLLGSWRRFQERFVGPVEKLHDREAGDRLRRMIRPFILRRTKSQVLDTLPPKTEITLAVELGDRERAFYESLRRGAVERLESDPTVAEKKRFQILAEIMRLRRACCAPELISGGEGIPSAKQEQFTITLGELVENNHKVLVFSQFVDHLSIIRRHLEKRGYSYQYLDGSTPVRSRKKAVEEFQAGVGDVFLISLKAGGLGLNLTAADYVIHMDPWWNPAVEDQASDRAHRIGQEKPVTVYRLVAAGTIEEKIVELHRDKRDLADNLLSGADQAATLDMEEIMQLLRNNGKEIIRNQLG